MKPALFSTSLRRLLPMFFFIARRTENGVTTKEVHGKVLTYKHIFLNLEKIPAAPPCLPEKTRAGLNLPSINIYGL